MRLVEARALSCACLLLAVPLRPYPEERQLLDRRLETLRRILPDQPNPPADVALVREMAEGARLGQLDVAARPPLESGSRGMVPVHVAALARYEEIDRFFRQVALSPRLIDVEALTLAAAPGGLVRLTASLHVPYRPARAPLPPAPDGPRPAAPRPQAEAFLRDQALLAAKSEQVAELRRTRRNPRLFLSELAAVVRDRPVLLSRASLDRQMLVSGLAMGEGAMRGLQSRFERGFFRVAEVLVARQGACLRFELRGEAPVVGPDAEIPLPGADPFDVEDGVCAAGREQGRAVTIRAPHSRTPQAGPLHLRLRDMDVSDVFQVLHLASGQGFVVDGDVQGRLNLEVAGLDLERTLSLLGKAGLRVSPPGPLRRVSRAGREAPGGRAAAAPAEGPRLASVLLKRATVRDVLALLDEAAVPPPAPPAAAESAPAAEGNGPAGDNGGPPAAEASAPALRPTWAPPGELGRISIWGREVSVEALRGLVLDAAALVERIEDERRLVGTAGASAGAPAPVRAAEAKLRLLMQPEDLATLEMGLSGLALLPQGWTALAYSPGGALFQYRRGDRLADAEVAAVESTDLLLETEEGPLRLTLPDLPR